MKKLILITSGILGMSILSFAMTSGSGVTLVEDGLYQVDNPNGISSEDNQTIINDIDEMYGVSGEQTLQMIEVPGWVDKQAMDQSIDILKVNKFFYRQTKGKSDSPKASEIANILSTYAY